MPATTLTLTADCDRRLVGAAEAAQRDFPTEYQSNWQRRP